MTPEDVGRVLDEIGERIGPAGEYAWGLAVRQTYIDAAQYTIFGFIGLVVGLVVARYVWRRDSDGTFAIYNGEDRVFGSVIPGLLAAAGALALSNGIGILLNPEFRAMTRLLERIVPQ